MSIKEPKFSFQAFKAVLNWHQILIPYPKKQNITGREPKMWPQFRRLTARYRTEISRFQIRTEDTFWQGPNLERMGISVLI